MDVNDKTVRKVARLARIAITDKEVAPLAKQMTAILDWVEQLNAVDTKGVAPMTGVVAMALPMRADRVTDGGKVSDIVANAPLSEDGFFLVPKVVE